MEKERNIEAENKPENKAGCIRKRLTALREEMKKENIQAYYIPTDDFHGSEYVSEYFKEREYMSGFTGSAGTLIVTETEAGLFTDGRYFLQAERELRETGITLYKVGEKDVLEPEEYLVAKLTEGQTLGFDGRCVTAAKRQEMESVFLKKRKKICFRGDIDLPGRLWNDRPSLPKAPAYVLPVTYAGEEVCDKLKRVRQKISVRGAFLYLLTSLDDIAWLLNIRGADIRCSPLVLSYLVISEKEAVFYCGDGTQDDQKVAAVREHLHKNGISIKGYFSIYEELKAMAAGKTVLADLDKVNDRLYRCLEKEKVSDCLNPTSIMKAIKNETETENERKAHLKDAIAYAKFLYWFKKETEPWEVTETDVAKRLLSEREKQEGFMGESFEPIVAYGEHGAVVHYSPTKETDCYLAGKSFVLIDTGGQYYEGTTDVTRTLACGLLSEEEKKHYTLVLKGNLALGNARFLSGATGVSLDMLARKPLWEQGLDYNHGTGHGVGYFSCVHEGPNSIRYRIGKGKNKNVAFEAGMITSNEPGLYLTGQYGIRLENMMVCEKITENDFGVFLGFETLTLVPFELEAIEPAYLTDEEKMTINRYHKRVYETVSPYLEDKEKECLSELTRPL